MTAIAREPRQPAFDRPIIVGFAAVGVLSLAIVAAPLPAYVLLIGLFGLPHVLFEMRYVDERFAGRIPRSMLLPIGALLVVVAAARIGRWLHWLPAEIALGGELGAGAALAMAAMSAMPRRRLLAGLIAAALIGGVVLAPIWTLLVTAWLHNLTPLAFVAERSAPHERARRLAWLALPFLVLPALIATGLPAAALRAAFAVEPADTPGLFDAGAQPLSAFLPAGSDLDRVISLFAAAVTAQAMHYFAVIVLLPRMLGRSEGPGRTLVRWPGWTLFAVAVGTAGVASLAFYAANFGMARSAYGVAAALHTWIELPVLLIALGQVTGAAAAQTPATTTPGWP